MTAWEDLIYAARTTAATYPYEGRLVRAALERMDAEHARIVERIRQIPPRP